MNLEFQIHTLVFSFFFGILFSFLLNINYKILYPEKKWYQILSNFIFVIGGILLYFFGLQKINYGIFHPYSALLIIVGFLLEHYTHYIFIRMFAKWRKK